MTRDSIVVSVLIASGVLELALALENVKPMFELFLPVAILVVNFLAGFAVPGAVLTFWIYAFRVLRGLMRGRRLLSRALVVLALATVVLSAPVLILLRALAVPQLTVSACVGIITVYLVPMLRAEKVVPSSLIGKVRVLFSRLSRKIKIWYYKYLTRDLLAAYGEEFLIAKARLDEIRVYLIVGTLPLFALSLAPVAPMALALLVVLVRVVTSLKWELLDKITVAVASGALIVILSVTEVRGPLGLLVIPYALGIATSLVVAARALLAVLE